MKQTKPEATKRQSWSDAFQILNLLLEKLDRHGRDFLLDICNYNVRTAMLSLETMLSQGGWFQATDLHQPTFKIEERTIRVRVTEQRILKALAYGSGNIYSEGMADEYGLSNILKNQPDEISDMASPLLLKWFYDGLDRADLYSSVNFRAKETLMGTVKELFPLHPTLPQFVEVAFDHFRKHGILDRVLDSQDPSKWLYVLMPRGLALWESLAGSSELLEIYREDLWLKELDFDGTRTLLLDTDGKLTQCVKLCRMFANAEAALHRNLITAESKRKYISAFGKTTIAHHLLEGVNNSLWREYGDNRPLKLKADHSNLYEFVEQTEKALNETN